MRINRRAIIQSAAACALIGPFSCSKIGMSQSVAGSNRKQLLLRSSWQTVNIGDIAHTPGMLHLLEQHCPDWEVTLWPNKLNADVEQILRRRFPNLRIALDKKEQVSALEACDFFLHGSGPGIVGLKELKLAAQAGKPYGIGGITLNDDEIKNQAGLLTGARFVYLRDTDSLRALNESGVRGASIGFGPDATFALDIRDDQAADAVLSKHSLEEGKFLCAIPRLRYTPYWEIHPESRKPDPEKIATNEQFVEKDHAKLRTAIVAWVRKTKMKVLLAPEMTYALPLLKPLLFDDLPDDVKPMVVILDHYWLTAEANSVYSKSAAIASLEQHSPIMAIANGVPAILIRQPTDTRKGQMWRDVGLNDWIFEIDQTTGEEIASRLIEIATDLDLAKKIAQTARQFANEKMAAMVKSINTETAK